MIGFMAKSSNGVLPTPNIAAVVTRIPSAIKCLASRPIIKRPFYIQIEVMRAKVLEKSKYAPKTASSTPLILQKIFSKYGVSSRKALPLRAKINTKSLQSTAFCPTPQAV